MAHNTHWQINNEHTPAISSYQFQHIHHSLVLKLKLDRTLTMKAFLGNVLLSRCKNKSFIILIIPDRVVFIIILAEL